VEDPLQRFWFDRGIRLFGVVVTNEAEAAAHAAGRGVSKGNKAALENGARERTIARLLGEDMANSTAGYRDPMKD